jgi:ABC-2 type transport system permease protein
MNAYAAVVASRFSTALQYRSAAVAGALTQLFFGLVRAMIFDAFYASGTLPAPLSHADAITYVWLGQVLYRLVSFGPDPEVALLVRSGGIAYELTRPADLHTLWLARCLGERAATLTLRGLPIAIVASLLSALRPPATTLAGALFLVSVLLGMAVTASLAVVITVSLLWTLSGEGVSRLLPPLVFISSGIVVPLPLLPAGLQKAVAVLPFRALLDTPVQLYSGTLSGASAALALGHQIAWLAAFVVLGRVLLARGLRRVVVQGG